MDFNLRWTPTRLSVNFEENYRGVSKMNQSVAFHPLASWHRLSGLALVAFSWLALSLGATPARAATVPALQAVASVDINRYMGTWYQIGFYPNSFQKQCVSGTTADYALRTDGTVTVTNTCQTATGTPSTVIGQARIKQPRFLGVPVGAGVSSKLEVRFAPSYLAWIPLVWAPYWVIQLPEDYRYAVVGEPSRNYLWILSRTPSLSATDRAQIEGTLQQQGYDPTKLVYQPQ
jgi:apolipoprotein D and lipocalin family protein